MRYRVVISPNAQQEISEAFSFISQRSPANVARWLQGLYDRIASLESMPGCELAREARFIDNAVVRQIVFKSHRIIFFIDETDASVQVISVRHAARRAIGEPGEDAGES